MINDGRRQYCSFSFNLQSFRFFITPVTLQSTETCFTISPHQWLKRTITPFKFYKITKTPFIFSITLFIASLVTWFLFIKLAERGCGRGHLPLLLQKSIHFVFGTLRFLKHLPLFLRKLIPFLWNIKIPERWVENEILDSIALYTKKICTIPALLMTHIKHINKRANKSLNISMKYL